MWAENKSKTAHLYEQVSSCHSGNTALQKREENEKIADVWSESDMINSSFCSFQASRESQILQTCDGTKKVADLCENPHFSALWIMH